MARVKRIVNCPSCKTQRNLVSSQYQRTVRCFNCGQTFPTDPKALMTETQFLTSVRARMAHHQREVGYASNHVHLHRV